MKALAQVFAGRLHVDQQRQVVAGGLPILQAQLDASVPGDGCQMDRCVGRAADGGVDGNRVQERIAGQDFGGRQVLPDDLHRPLAGQVGALTPLAVGGRDDTGAGQRHAPPRSR